MVAMAQPQRMPQRMPELMVYQAIIAKASQTYVGHPTVRRLKICTMTCISNSLTHNLQGKRARSFLCLVFSNMTIAMILLYVSST